LVRHGETEWSITGQHTGRTDVALTAAGEEQAKALKPLLAGRSFELVASSPRKRALRTAQLAGFDAAVDDDLAEWDYGELEGLTTDEIRARLPGWAIWTGPWPGGELAGEIAGRADRVIERVMSLSAGQSALLFSHGHMLRVLAARWLGCPVTEGKIFALGTATVSVLGWERGLPAIAHWNVPPGFSAAASES